MTTIPTICATLEAQHKELVLNGLRVTIQATGRAGLRWYVRINGKNHEYCGNLSDVPDTIRFVLKERYGIENPDSADLAGLEEYEPPKLAKGERYTNRNAHAHINSLLPQTPKRSLLGKEGDADWKRRQIAELLEKEADGTSPYMIENQLCVPPGEDYLSYTQPRLFDDFTYFVSYADKDAQRGILVDEDVALLWDGKDGIRVVFPRVFRICFIHRRNVSVPGRIMKQVARMRAAEAADDGDPAETRLIEVYNPERRQSEWIEVKK